jgi:arabinogalactan endo-1,4-beta-galactosidase
LKKLLLIGFICFITGTFFSTPVKAVLGADLSWVTQMEASGYTWKNASGTTQDIFVICKGLGFNACRLRVWVNPSGGWCGQADVVAKAKRAVAQGMYLYIDFHFSDSWADPSKQTPPAAWTNYTVSQMNSAISTHVKSVLNALKSAGCTPTFISIGNETNNGLLWPLGKASTNPANYAAFIKAGYTAAKSVFSSASVGVHVSNMWDNSLWTWNYGILKTYGVSWDFCGGSLYPTTSNYATLISQSKTNVASMKSKYGKWCVVSEFGIANNAGTTGATALKSARTICNDLFYWEPEAYNWQGYGLGAWDAVTKKPTVVLTSGLKSADELNFVELPETSDIEIYPNPSNGEVLNLNLGNMEGSTTIRIINVNGKILEQIVFANQQTVSLDNLNLSSGVYFVQIDNFQQKEIRTIVVK